MKRIVFIIKKIFFRLFRIATFNKGVYCKKGKHNKFVAPVFLHEKSQIGKYNYFGPYCMSLHTEIGNYNTFGPGTKIGQSQHNTKYVTAYPRITEHNIGFDNSAKKTIIHNDVWTGANVVIMAGVTIGTGAVIGANAVVTHDIPPYAIAVGVPAKVIKYRFNEETIEGLLESQWWDNDFDEAKIKVAELANKYGLSD